MGKRCVQLVHGLLMKMCTTATSAQRFVVGLYKMCTNHNYYTLRTQPVHTLISAFYYWPHTPLSTQSTEPITTTIGRMNKDQGPIKKEIL